MCDSNTTNTPSGGGGGTYSAANLGAGNDIYAGSSVVGSNTEFQFKSLLPGTNITMSNNADTITINASSSADLTSSVSNAAVAGNGVLGTITTVGNNTNYELKRLVAGTNITMTNDATTITVNASGGGGLTTLTNIGAGAQIVESVALPNANIRSITAGFNISATQNASTIEITSIGPMSEPLEVYYNYAVPITVSFSSSIQAGSLLTTTVVSTPNSELEGTVQILTPVVFIFTPAPRRAESTIIPVRVNFANGAFISLLIKLVPRLFHSTNPTRDLLICAGKDGIIYMLDNQSQTQYPLLNLDSTPVSPIIGSEVVALCMDRPDNLLFYVLASNMRQIRYYSFTTKLTGIVILNLNVLAGWNSGNLDVKSMCYDELYSRLYFSTNNSGSKQGYINIPPHDPNNIRWGQYGLLLNILPVSGSTINMSYDLRNNHNCAVFKVGVAAAQVHQRNCLGGASNVINGTFVLPVDETMGVITTGASDKLYCVTSPSRQVLRTLDSNGLGSLANTWVLTQDINDITGDTPWGLI